MPGFLLMDDAACALPCLLRPFALLCLRPLSLAPRASTAISENTEDTTHRWLRRSLHPLLPPLLVFACSRTIATKGVSTPNMPHPLSLVVGPEACLLALGVHTSREGCEKQRGHNVAITTLTAPSEGLSLVVPAEMALQSADEREQEAGSEAPTLPSRLQSPMAHRKYDIAALCQPRFLRP